MQDGFYMSSDYDFDMPCIVLVRGNECDDQVGRAAMLKFFNDQIIDAEKHITPEGIARHRAKYNNKKDDAERKLKEVKGFGQHIKLT